MNPTKEKSLTIFTTISHMATLVSAYNVPQADQFGALLFYGGLRDAVCMPSCIFHGI